ncbi:putative uncharacterized transposon-derived protein F54H12.3, partial [Orchesella cincta]
KSYIHQLDDFLRAYNNSYHRSLGCSPNQSTIKNKDFSLKDRVRIKASKSTFDKGYVSSYTNSLFQIHDVLKTNPTTYKLIDADGDLIEGIFYKEELSRVNNST